MNPAPPLRLAILISGGGTTLRNLLDKIDASELNATIALVISSNPAARGLNYAKDAGIPFLVVERKREFTPEQFRDAIFNPLREAKVDYVIMGGFLKHVLIPADFASRVLNIHPGLIPKHCGKGMFGHHVHESVLASGDAESGCTVHFVDDEYDHGPVILQRRVPVLPGDTAETLAARVFTAECEAYPAALRQLAAKRSL